MIIVQSPLRISFFGGGTDFPSFYMGEGGCVLSTTIDKYIFVTIKQRFDEKLRIGYTRTEIVDRVDEIKHELIRDDFLRVAGRRLFSEADIGRIETGARRVGRRS